MKPNQVHRSWAERLAMTAVFIANGLGFGAWAGNIPRLKDAAGLSDGALGVVLLCVSLGAVGAMQLAGRYAARVGTGRASLLAALLLGAVLPLPAFMPAFMPGWWPLLASAALFGVALGMLDVCMNAHASWMERRWGAPVMSSFHAGWSLGQLAGAASAGLLARLPLPWALGAAGALIAALGVAAALLPEEPGRSTARARFGWPSRRIVVLGTLIALSFAIEGGAADWSGVYLRTVLAVPPQRASWALAAFAGVMVLIRLGGDRMVLRLGPARAVCYGGIAAAAGLVLALSAPGLAVAIIGFALVGAGVSNIVPVVFGVAGRQGPAGISAVATAGYGAVMATPPLIGFVSQGLGLRAGLGLLVVAAIGVAMLGRRVAD